ncbi:very short patch repair endonuclease [Clavibacter michiganensis]|uniref:very short patch repair endonuclease n=1 Tax=Clavibacter michiganensis TaxID=28447 RepID=UPI001C2093F5|nr:very short patch repair endonuclease [Clavibacter michiganensis]
MSANKRWGTWPELLVRRSSTPVAYGMGATTMWRSRSCAEIAFTRQSIAVFIDGCFWHS